MKQHAGERVHGRYLRMVFEGQERRLTECGWWFPKKYVGRWRSAKCKNCLRIRRPKPGRS